MKKHNQPDERVTAQKRKIESEAFNLLWIGLIISALVQLYGYNAPFKQYAVEILLLIAASIYVVIRNLLGGNDLFTSKKGGQAEIVTKSLACGVIVAVISGIVNYGRYSKSVPTPAALNTALAAGITFISAALAAFALLELIYFANKKKQKDITSHLDEDE